MAISSLILNKLRMAAFDAFIGISCKLIVVCVFNFSTVESNDGHRSSMIKIIEIFLFEVMY